MNQNQNKDWMPVAALILAVFALFAAIGGPRDFGNDQASTTPQQIIVQPAPPPAGGTGAIIVTAPPAPTGVTQVWGGGGRHFFPFFPFFPLILVAGLFFLTRRAWGRNHWGWGRQWGGPGPHGPGPMYGPYGQPNYPQGGGQNQPPAGYPQGQQPQQPPQGQAYQGYPGQPTQNIDQHGDITRPEGGNY